MSDSNTQYRIGVFFMLNDGIFIKIKNIFKILFTFWNCIKNTYASKYCEKFFDTLNHGYGKSHHLS